jgi:hypothetical protein
MLLDGINLALLPLEDSPDQDDARVCQITASLVLMHINAPISRLV